MDARTYPPVGAFLSGLVTDRLRGAAAAASTDAIRGAALSPFITWYAGTHGRSGLVRALNTLPDADRRLFDERKASLGVSLAAWYRSAMIHRMLDGLLAGMPPQERTALATSGAAQTLAASLTGTLAVVFRALVSPAVCALVGPRIWQAFYSGGRVRITAPQARCHVMEVTDWPGHHGFLCEMNNAAGRSIYRAAGCSAVTTEHAACIDRGDRSCVYVIRW